MPHVVRADLKAAQTALGAGDFVAALKEVQPVWQTHPLDAALITARSNLELGRPDLAEKAARDALTMKPDSYAALLLLGSVLQRQDKVIAAEYYTEPWTCQRMRVPKSFLDMFCAPCKGRKTGLSTEPLASCRLRMSVRSPTKKNQNRLGGI